VELPAIAEQPTRADAEVSLQLLNDLLSGFPFVNKVDRSVALAAILTTTLRGAFAVAPMFLFLAPESGTGKTYLVAVISTIATGRAAPALVGCSDPNEMEKRLSAAAFEAMPILSLNNLSFDLESDLLCQMTSDREVKIRRFGVLELIRCDCSGTTAFANGNNIRVVGDLVRRTLTCHLDAKMESSATIKAMLADLDAHLEEIKADPESPNYLANLYQLRELLILVQKERVAEAA
jgi:hypothetical protein